MTSHLARLLADHYATAGMDRDEALRLAEATIGTLVAAEALQAGHVEAWERDARIYELRGQGLAASVIGLRVSLSRARVFDAVRRHGKRRRAALRAA